MICQLGASHVFYGQAVLPRRLPLRFGCRERPLVNAILHANGHFYPSIRLTDFACRSGPWAAGRLFLWHVVTLIDGLSFLGSARARSYLPIYLRFLNCNQQVLAFSLVIGGVRWADWQVWTSVRSSHEGQIEPQREGSRLYRAAGLNAA